MNEADTCREYVVPKLVEADWDTAPHSLAEQCIFTGGRLFVVRGKQQKAHYIAPLYVRLNELLAKASEPRTLRQQSAAIRDGMLPAILNRVFGDELMAITTRNPISPFSSEHLEALSKVLGDTERGLTGTEIGHILGGMRVTDVDSASTKRRRLFNALAEFQNKEQVGNHVIVFIVRAMEPAKYTGNVETFHWRRDRLNEVLAFCGYALGEDGKVRKADQASSLDEALERANRLGSQLRQRGVHADVLRFCNSEILAKNYFHAVFEALKSITAKLREQTGLTSDGAAIVDAAFSFSSGTNPLLAINALDTETLKGEQRGFISLLKGLYGVIRNPLAHEPKIEWEMTEQDALDILTMLSLVHRKLDKAHRPL